VDDCEPELGEPGDQATVYAVAGGTVSVREAGGWVRLAVEGAGGGAAAEVALSPAGARIVADLLARYADLAERPG
jgi:Protein of unknown function (DUF2384)